MAKTISVQVKKCQLRNKPSFLGKIVDNLNYADEVTVEQEKNDWLEVIPANKKNAGWVHVSALSEKKIVLQKGSKDITSSASSDELALAGKGFNEQVENDFKKKNKDIDFTWIDKMEMIVVSPEEKLAFLSEGGLVSKGGEES